MPFLFNYFCLSFYVQAGHERPRLPQYGAIHDVRSLMFLRLLLTALCGFSWAALAATKPNILVILADDLGYSDLGCYGSEIATPNLDQLATNGLRFTDFHNTGRCWPTRGALMTGYYPQQVRMDPQPRPKENKGFPAWTRTIPQMLKPLGYRSYHSGKWHIGCAPRILADASFDRSYHLADQSRHFSPSKHTLDDKPMPAVDRSEGFFGTVAIADHAIEFLRQHQSGHADDPFFAYVAFTAPHFPLMAWDKDIQKYRGKYARGWDVMREERFERMKKMGLVRGELSAPEPQIHAPSGDDKTPAQLNDKDVFTYVPWDSLTEAQRQFQAEKMAIHAAMIDRIDIEVGRILDQIKAMKQFEDTLIVFLSDNGASAEIMVRGDGHDPLAPIGSAATHLCLGPGWSTMCNTPFRRHKIWTHDGGTSTPLVMHWPNGIATKGALRHDAGHVVDLMPTILDAAGAPAAKVSLSAPAFPGRSLLPAFAKDGSVQHDYLFFHHQGNRGLRVGSWKLVSSKDDGDAWELYDFNTDRSEQHNLAPQMKEKVTELQAKWEALEAQFAKESAE